MVPKQGTEIDATATEVIEDAQDTDSYDLFADLENVLTDGDEVSTDESDGEGGGDSSDTDDVGDETGETVVVKVDGEEIEVTLDELKAGYSRQSDYTRKTQALAAEREQMAGLLQLADALQANPEAALAELARAFEVDLAPSAEIDDDGYGLDDDDPIMRELKELREWKSEIDSDREYQRREAQDRALQATLDQIKVDNSDPEMDEEELLRFAVDHQIADLAIAYELKSAREGRSKVSPALEAKRAAPPVETATRRGARKGTGRIESIADALRSALAEQDG